MLSRSDNISVCLDESRFVKDNLSPLTPCDADFAVCGKRTAARLAFNRLMNHIAEQIHPSDNSSARVDKLKIKQSVVESCARNKLKSWNLTAVSRDECAERNLVFSGFFAVFIHCDNRSATLCGKKILHSADKISDPADFLLQIRVCIVNHVSIETDSADDKEPVPCGFGRGVGAVQKRYFAHVDSPRTVTCRDKHGSFDVACRDIHVAREKISGADGDDSHRMFRACHCGSDCPHCSVAADRNNRVRA